MLIVIVECMVILILGYCCYCCLIDNFDSYYLNIVNIQSKLRQYVHCYVMPIEQIELRESERERTYLKYM